MPVQIFIPTKQIEDLIAFYEVKLKDIKQKKKDLDAEESEIKSTILQLKSKRYATVAVNVNELPALEPNKSVYYNKWSWVKRIEFAIRDAGKPITTNEIVEILMKHDTQLDKRKAVTSVSSILSIKSSVTDETDKPFIKIEEEKGRSKYYIKHGKEIPEDVTLLDVVQQANDFIDSIIINPTKADDNPF